MRIKIWHVLAAWGVVLILGTIGAADMGGMSSTQIIIQVFLGIGLIVLAYRWFIAACDRAYKKRWAKYDRH